MTIAQEPGSEFDPNQINDEGVAGPGTEASSGPQAEDSSLYDYDDSSDDYGFSPEESLTEPSSNFKQLVLVAGGSALAATALVSSLFFLKGGDDPTETVRAKEAVATDTNPSELPSETPVSNEKTSAGAVKNTVLGIVAVSDADIKLTRPGGEEILVPRLTARSVSEFTDSFLTLYACYMTTGSDLCADEISTKPKVREGLIRTRDYFGVDDLQKDDYNKDAQLEIYGDPFFLSGEVSTPRDEPGTHYYIELDPDTDLRAYRQGGAAWQSHENPNIAHYKFDSMRVEYTLDESGKPYVTSFTISTTIL